MSKSKEEQIVNTDELLSKFKGKPAALQAFLVDLKGKAISAMLEGEMDEHLGYEKHSLAGNNSGNSRNGKTTKTVKSPEGEIEISVPRDRTATFEPKIVKKHARSVESLKNIVISMFAKGMSHLDIQEFVKEAYEFEISSAQISRITERVMEEVQAWQNRPLEKRYAVIWLDGMVIKVRDEQRVVKKTVYIIVGLNGDGHRDILGLWLGEVESAKYWLKVLNELKSRGVEDILISCSDNLKGLTEAIEAVYPQTSTQICVVHQIRNAARYTNYKDSKAFHKDMRQIYTANSLQEAEDAMDNFEAQWAKKYQQAVDSWRRNWTELTHFLSMPLELRKIIYTTNIIENLNRQIRKYIKTKASFPNDKAALKSVFLALRETEKRYAKQTHNWGIIRSQLYIIFGAERCTF